jgi:hypothetical protein
VSENTNSKLVVIKVRRVIDAPSNLGIASILSAKPLARHCDTRWERRA